MLYNFDAKKHAEKQNEIYIYKAMSVSAGYSILRKKLKQKTTSELQFLEKTNQPLWLIRESNKPGLLTIDYISYDNAIKKWEAGSHRMALTNNGWVGVGSSWNEENMKNMSKEERGVIEENSRNIIKDANPVNSKNANIHEAELLKYIDDIQERSFKIVNRINPALNEQTLSPVYSSYQIVCNENNIPQVSLTPGVKQAITCEITGNAFEFPVVMKRDILIKSAGKEDFILYKGRSYEKETLEKFDVKPTDYFPNITLRNIINRIGSQDIDKIELLLEERAFDVVNLETLENPMIISSGHTLSKDTINKLPKQECPSTRIPFNKEDVISNINLAQFISEWPYCKEQLICTIENTKGRNLKRSF